MKIKPTEAATLRRCNWCVSGKPDTLPMGMCGDHALASDAIEAEAWRIQMTAPILCPVTASVFFVTCASCESDLTAHFEGEGRQATLWVEPCAKCKAAHIAIGVERERRMAQEAHLRAVRNSEYFKGMEARRLGAPVEVQSK